MGHILHTRPFIDYAISTTAGVNHPRTSWNSIQEFHFALPPNDVQIEISSALSVIDNKIAVERKRKEILENLFQSFLYQLMTGTIRVDNRILLIR